MDGGSLSIEVVPPATIVLDGPIDERAAQRLREEITGREIASATVILNSPGGLLMEGIALGRLIRQLGFSTSVAPGGVCHSACVFALLGGVYRFGAAQSRIGVHRFSSSSAAVDADTAQVVAAAVVNYIREMGADVDLFDRMTRKGSGQLLVLGQKELRQLGVINDGRLAARWALQAQGPVMVLKGVQETSEGKGEVRLSCQDNQVQFQLAFSAGERADELVSAATRHLMRIGEGFVPLPEPVEPLSAHEGYVSGTFVLGPGQLKRLANPDSIGYAVQSSGRSSGFAVDTAGGGAEDISNFLASCLSR
jgi:Clp protease